VSETSPSYLRFFPYDAPYDHQREAMATIADALDDGRDVLFEGATGTGKTLAALTPALEHARVTGRTVVITTNVHQQTRQFIEEARAINEAESLRAVVFRGKLDMCHLDVGYDECQAMREATRDAVEAEAATDGLDPDGAVGTEADDLAALGAASEDVGETCEHYRRNLVADTEPFYEWLFGDVRTPEEVFAFAGERGFCGYELLKEGVEGVDLAIANYHHLLDPAIREQFFRWLGREPEEVLAVFDEAHNLAEAARDRARRTLAEPTLDAAVEECADAVDPRADRAANVVRAFRDALVATCDEALAFGEREAVDDDWYDLAIANDDARDDLTLAFLEAYTGSGIHGDIESALEFGGELDSRYGEAYKRGETETREQCRLLGAAEFLEAWLDDDGEGRHRVASVRRDQGTDELYGRAELYTCIPRRVTAPLFEELHASVLMSATLRPFDVLRDTLGVDDDPVEMAYGAQFPPGRRRTYAVDVPALFASRREDPELQQRVAGALEDVVRFTPGNTLAFFPSYAEAERYRDLVDVAATTYLDEPATRAQDLKESFVADDDGLLLTSLWGTLGEGVSFDGDDARTAVVVGVPYPHLDDRTEAVQAAYEAAFGGRTGGVDVADDGDGIGWRYAVEIPTVRKTRQALGRVVRSPEDFGVRVLIDERYTERARREMPRYSVTDAFPPEERSEIIDVEPRKLKFAMLNFYSDMDAWDEPPPQP